jgi:hypothetical protein
MAELTALSPTGMLGYGIPETSFRTAIDRFDVDYIGCDAGSIDQGPNYLGRGKFLADEKMVERDLRLLLRARDDLDVPLLVSSAGGSGSATHLERTAEIVREIAAADGLSFDLALIYTDIDRDLFKHKLDCEEVQILDYQATLSAADVDAAERIVGQIGPEPYMEALDAGADVILGGRSVDESPFAALPLWEGFDPGLAFHMAKILECGAMASQPRSGSDCLIGRIDEGGFEVEPTAPERRCTEQSVAAHTLYEKADPYTLHLPSGEVDVSDCDFEQVTDRRVRVTGSEYHPSDEYTLLVEGVERRGFRTITPAGIRGTEATTRIDDIVEGVMKTVSELVDAPADAYSLDVRRYGRDAVPISALDPLPPQGELGIVIDVVAETQALADTVCGAARSTMLHHSFEGRLAVSGNLAIPYSPADVSLGPNYEFSIHHLLGNVTPAELYDLRTEVVA